MEDAGKFEARYLAFLETISPLRPRLHRYCARMTGSITDGEDVVQDALFRAYRSLETWDDSRPLAPWIFRIAHNQCIDFLRSRGVRVEAEAAVAEPGFVEPADPDGPAILETDSAARVLLLWGRRPADPSRIRSRVGPEALGRVRALLSGY